MFDSSDVYRPVLVYRDQDLAHPEMACNILYSAISIDDVEAVERILDSTSLDINALPNRTVTPIFHAIYNNSPRCVCKLLQRGADLLMAVETQFGRHTALHVAAGFGRTEITTMLLQYGADTETVAQFGKTALHIAVQYEYAEIVQLLLKNGANVNAITDRGFTPLLYAVEKGCTDIVKMLLRHNADLEVKYNLGKNILHIAVQKCTPDIIGHIVDLELKLITVEDNTGRTPVEYVNRDDIFNVFVNIVARFDSLCYNVNQRNINYLRERNEDAYNSIYKKCQAELERMRNRSIHVDYRICIHDILNKSEKHLLDTLKNTEIRLALASINYWSEFPIYYNEIYKRVKTVTDKVELREKGEHLINEILNHKFNFPDVCLANINKYFNDHELRELIDSFK